MQMSNSVRYLSIPAKYNYMYSYLRKKLVFLFYQFVLSILLALKELYYLKQDLQRFLHCAGQYLQRREIRIVEVIKIMSY